MYLFHIGICLIIIGTISFIFFYFCYTDNDYQKRMDISSSHIPYQIEYIRSKLNSSNSIHHKYLHHKLNLIMELNQEIEVLRDNLSLFNNQEVLYKKLYEYNCKVYDHNRLANYFHLTPQILISKINNVEVLMISPSPIKLTGKYKQEWMNKLYSN